MHLPAKWGTWLMAMAVVLASVLLSTWIAGLGPFAVLEKKSYDLDFVLRAKLPKAIAAVHPPAAITLVWIDTPTADFLAKPRMLWPAEFGEVIKAATASGARVIGLDYYFSYPVTRWDEAADPLFFQAYLEATQHGVPVILAYEREEQERSSEKLVPVYYQAVADGNVGYAELNADPDSYVRTLEWQAKPGQGNQPAPLSFAAKIVTSILGPAVLSKIPAIAERTMAINYYGPRGATFFPISMRKVLEAMRAGDHALLESWFKGRVVLIGPDDLPDRHPTPFYFSADSQLMEGTEIHAHAISTMIQEDFLHNASRAQEWEFLVGAAILATLVGFAIRWPLSLLGTAVLLAGAFGVSVLSHDHGVILPLVPAELAVILATLGSYGGRLLTQDRQRAMLEKAFSNMVSPEVMNSIIDAGGLPTEGRRCEITVMFSDIRGFTAYSEGRDPAGVVIDLNEYFGVMADCIMRNGGMVNKYIGDGIMALFGAPVPHPDHAHRAVACAQEMMVAMDVLNSRRSAAGLEPWRIGVGIHTGEAVVGFVGARDKKLEYTANGATVNFASRLESLNKELGTQVLLSAATRDAMGVDIATVWKGQHAVKGIVEAQNVYTV